MNCKKPRLYSKVYILIWVDHNTIAVECHKVGFKNTHAFAIEVADPIMYDCYKVYEYSEYGKLWFSTLKEAKDYTYRVQFKKLKKVHDQMTGKPFWTTEED